MRSSVSLPAALLVTLWSYLSRVDGGKSVICLSCTGSTSHDCRESPAFSDNNGLVLCANWDSNYRKIERLYNGTKITEGSKRMKILEVMLLKERDNQINETKNLMNAMFEAVRAKKPWEWTEAKQPPNYPGLPYYLKKNMIFVEYALQKFWVKKLMEYLNEGRDIKKSINNTAWIAEFDSFVNDTIWDPLTTKPAEGTKERRLLGLEDGDGWCATFEHIAGGEFRRGCGVHIEDMKFEPGCQNIKGGKYNGLRYCRCDWQQCNDMVSYSAGPAGFRGSVRPALTVALAVALASALQ